MPTHFFKNILAWQKARELVPIIYKLVKKFPDDEKYALVSQIKRATVSISSNIAEGSGRNTNADFAHFLDMSLGSSFELESELIISCDLGFISEQQFNEILKILGEVQKLIIGFQNTIR
jgi:four helix bundle protein